MPSQIILDQFSQSCWFQRVWEILLQNSSSCIGAAWHQPTHASVPLSNKPFLLKQLRYWVYTGLRVHPLLLLADLQNKYLYSSTRFGSDWIWAPDTTSLWNRPIDDLNFLINKLGLCVGSIFISFPILTFSTFLFHSFPLTHPHPTNNQPWKATTFTHWLLTMDPG